LHGDVGDRAGEQFRAEMHDLLCRGRLHVAVDVLELGSITPSAVLAVHDGHRWLSSLGGHFEICGAARDVDGGAGTASWFATRRRSLAETIALPPFDGAASDHVSLGLAPDAGSTRAVRLHLSRVLHDWRKSHLVDDLVLATNELVTNAIVHARAPFEVRMDNNRNAVRVEVRDPSFREVTRPSDIPTPHAAGGRGLSLVEHLTDRWGVDELDEGKSVWFELLEPVVT
jgi:anti-sigma regulatory factor (Ser/Thr protein kinase)